VWVPALLAFVFVLAAVALAFWRASRPKSAWKDLWILALILAVVCAVLVLVTASHGRGKAVAAKPAPTPAGAAQATGAPTTQGGAPSKLPKTVNGFVEEFENEVLGGNLVEPKVKPESIAAPGEQPRKLVDPAEATILANGQEVTVEFDPGATANAHITVRSPQDGTQWYVVRLGFVEPTARRFAFALEGVPDWQGHDFATIHADRWVQPGVVLNPTVHAAGGSWFTLEVRLISFDRRGAESFGKIQVGIKSSVLPGRPSAAGEMKG